MQCLSGSCCQMDEGHCCLYDQPRAQCRKTSAKTPTRFEANLASLPLTETAWLPLDAIKIIRAQTFDQA
jgi:hypothetical protein